MVKLAESESDFATQAFLQWFVTEQVEEESQVRTIVERLKLTGETPIGVVILDGELGKRGGYEMPFSYPDELVNTLGGP